jgi:DNA-binding NtrC family response regulator
LLHPVAVLGAAGVRFVNAAWRDAVVEGRICAPLCHDPGAEARIAPLVQLVLQGSRDHAEAEYACAPGRAGTLAVTPCEVGGERGALLQILGGTAGRAVPPAPPSGTRRIAPTPALAAQSDSTVLLLGESGAGKTHLAREIHDASRRAGGPFVDINCAGLSAALLESELFGHERGAFTGATVKKRGLLEEAEGGTMFLDEIGELDAVVQAKLLKVLETRRFRRLGGTREIAAEARIIAATSRDLAAEVAAGRFREDLYYRVCVLVISVPPLRDRLHELPDLAARLLASIPRADGRPPPRLGPGAAAALTSHRWPGNVRELRNVLERASIGCGDEIGAEDLLAAIPAAPSAPAEITALAAREHDHVRRVLAATRGNLRQSAQILGISRSTLYERLRRYGIDLRTLRDVG